MAYYGMKRKNLPTWHNYYVAGSNEYVNPFAKASSGICRNNNYTYETTNTDGSITTNYYLDDFGKLTKKPTDYFTNCPVYKGCGLAVERLEKLMTTESYDGNSAIKPSNANKTGASGANRTLTLTRTNGTLTIKEGSTTLNEISNAGPLVYFELIGGGGGGAGGCGQWGGGGGGGGGGATGVLDFTVSSTFTIQIGGGGLGAIGALDSAGHYFEGGAKGGDSIIWIGTSSSGKYLFVEGGAGAVEYKDAVAGMPHGHRASGGSIMYINSSSADSVSNNTVYGNAIYVFNALAGGSGGCCATAKNEAEKTGEGVDSTDFAVMTFSDGSKYNYRTMNHVLHSGGMIATNYTTAGGSGGASALAGGGQGAGYYDSFLDYATHGYYGAGGGGSVQNTLIWTEHGIDPRAGNGGAGELILGWVEVT